MTVLVTGATGNVGSQVVRELRERGVVVRAFVRDPAEATAMLGEDVDLALGEFARDHAAAFGDPESAYASTSPRRMA